MPNVNNIKGSDGSGAAGRATVTGVRSASATTITVDSVTHWPEQFIAATGTLNNTTGVISPGTLQVFFGHLSGDDIVIDTFAPGYSDLGNSIGDVVILKPVTAWADEIAALFEVAHDDDGSLNDTALGEAATAAQTAIEASSNFRPKPRVSATTSTATLTPNIGSYNVYELNAQAADLTIAAPTGTPNDADPIVIRIKDNGTSRALTWNSAYANVSGLDSLTATTISKWHTIGILYNAGASKWQIVSITTEA